MGFPDEVQPLHVVTLRDRYALHDDDQVIGAHQLTIEAGITYRQLDFWTRCGHLVPLKQPRGSGYPRVYPLDQVPLAREMGRLVNAGVQPTERAHAAALQLLATGTAELGDYQITPRHQETA